jgi:putative flippase GtrA
MMDYPVNDEQRLEREPGTAIRTAGGWRGLLGHTALKFAGVGVINTLLCVAVIFGLKSMAGFADVPANVAGYAVGLACSFLLNRRWTFAHDDRLLPALLRFMLVFVVSYLFNIAAVLGALHLGCNDYLAHLVGMPLYSVAFYFGCRYFVFPQSGPRKADMAAGAP